MINLFTLLLCAGAMLLYCGKGDSDVRTGGQSESISAREESAAPAEIEMLKIGDDAPLFALPGTPDEKEIVLTDAIKEKPVLLAFFPKAFTGG